MIASNSVHHCFFIVSALISFFLVVAFITSQRSSYDGLQSPEIAQTLGLPIVNGGGHVYVDTTQQRLETSLSATASSSTGVYLPPIPSATPLPLPLEYQESLLPASQWCSDRFESAYLTNLSKTQTEHCDPMTSTSNLRCFNTPTGRKGRVDSFCIGGPSLFDSQENKFQLDCELRQRNHDEAEKTTSIKQFPNYWYHTGPRVLMERYLGFGAPAEHISELAKEPRKFTIIIRREEAIDNLWHELWEIMAMTLTLDVLRMSHDPATGLPLFALDDVENTRILIEDNWDDGPFFSLWTMFAKRPITRISKISANDFRDPETIIFPLPGESNPMWHVDWEVFPCDHAALLNVFSKRVMDFYGVERSVKLDDSPLVLTFIDRREKRRLIEKEDYIEELKKTYPNIQVQMVNFAAIPVAEQLKVVRNADILIGVHGAGLTHSLFLPPDSAVVEIQPAEFKGKGFRNLAHLLGHHYFSSHAMGPKGNWQYDDFSYDKARFMRLVDTAIASMYNRGSRNDDVL
ncbi:hypothetical protein MMC10_009695 [Thelotrema lepadinum]|nr:hypothetical protein [Thelotrema lepadinum]